MASVTAANSYISNNKLWTDSWDDASDDLKRKAVNQAENQLKGYSITDDELIYEQALFLLQLGPEDRARMKLQNQGVKSISVSKGVSESYDLKYKMLCEAVRNCLETGSFRPGDMT